MAPRARVGLGCLLLLVGACRCAGAPGAAGPGRDATVERPADAHRPPRREAAAEASTDGGGCEAGPGWRPVTVPEATGGCAFERAACPERFWTPRWRGCGPGCRALEAPEYMKMVVTPLAGVAEGRGLVAILLQPDGRAWDYFVLLDVDGGVVAAWRSKNTPNRYPGCGVSTLAIGEDRLALVLYVWPEPRPTSLYDVVYYGDPLRPETLDTPLTFFENELPYRNGEPQVFSVDRLQEMAVSREVIAGRVVPRDELWLISPEDGHKVVRGGYGASAQVPGSPQGHLVQGPWVYWNPWSSGATIGVARASLTEPGAYVLHEPGARLYYGLDSQWVVWLAGYGWGGPEEGFERMDLWVAPYRPDGRWEGRKLIEDVQAVASPNLVYWQVSGGYATSVTYDETVRRWQVWAVRLPDGPLLRWQGSARAPWAPKVLWVHDGKVAVQGYWGGERTAVVLELSSFQQVPMTASGTSAGG